MDGKVLLNTVISNGINVSIEKRGIVVKEIDEAIKEHRLHYIEQRGQLIGFLVCKKKGNKIFVNNCAIYKKFQNIGSLMVIRNTLRRIYKNIDCFYWKSRKRNRICYAK